MSNFSNLSRQIVPYNITGLQDINVNTINGTVPFNGVIANANYPLSFNTSTGILSQTPITQNINSGATVNFSGIRGCNTIYANTPTQTSINIGGNPANGYNYVQMITTITNENGGSYRFMTGNNSYRGYIGADSGWVYVSADASTSQGIYFSASGICRMASAYSYVDFYIGFSSRATMNTTLFNLLVPITTTGTITAPQLTSSSATNLILNAPTGQTINFNIAGTTYLQLSSTVFGSTVPISCANIITRNINNTSSTIDLSLTCLSSRNINFDVGSTNILTINSSGLTTNNIKSQTTNTLILDGNVGIDFNVNGITYAQMTSTGLLVNNVNSIAGQDLFLSSITGIIKTDSSFNMYGGYLNLFDYSTGLIESRLLTDTTGLIISTPSTKDMRFKIGTNTILTIASAGVSIQSLFTNGLTSNAFNNLVFDTPSGQKINFNIGGYNIGYVNSSALIFNNISSDTIISSDLNLNAPTSQKVNFNINNSGIGFVNSSGLSINNITSKASSNLILNAPTSQTINFNINNSASVIVDNLGLTSSNSSFFIKNSNSLRDIVLQAGGGVSICNDAGTYITRFNVAGSQIYLPYFSSGYYGITMLTSTFGNYYNHYISGTTYQIINASNVGVQLTYGSTSWASASDIRLKKNIQPLKNSLELINQLNPITYNWKDENMTNNNIGFIAQEVQEILPEITEDYDIKGDKYLGIRTTDLIPFLVKSIQELSKELNDIKTILKRNNIKY